MEIPAIDLTPYFDGSDKTAVAEQISRACEETGFFTIHGHQIDPDLMHKANAAAQQFFDQSESVKQQMTADGGMGYIGRQGEQLAASLDDDEVMDVKESLNLTWPISEAIWPNYPDHLREMCGAYYTELLNLSHHIMHLFALALGLPETWFDDKIDDPRTILRLLNYPATNSQNRAGAHTDYGTITILWSPDSRGLQAKTRSGDWVDVVAPSDHFIINIGDLMMNWTNDRWLSNLHQVVPHPETIGKRRQSIAFFHNPNPDALIACIDTCHDAQNPPRYEPILAKTHLEMKIAKSLGKEVKL